MSTGEVRPRSEGSGGSGHSLYQGAVAPVPELSLVTRKDEREDFLHSLIKHGRKSSGARGLMPLMKSSKVKA